MNRSMKLMAAFAATLCTVAAAQGDLVFNADFSGGIPAGYTLLGDAKLEGVPTVQSFDGGGTGFQLFQDLNAPPPAVIGGGPNGNFLRLTHDNFNNNRNHVAFDRSAFGGFGNLVADFDFRATSVGAAADGFSMLLVPTASNGHLGAGINANTGVLPEEPNVPGVFAVGFDLHPAASQNDVSIHFGSQIANVTLPNSDIDLDAGVFHHARVEVSPTVGGSNVTVSLTPDSLGSPGATVTPINNVFVAGLNPYESRLEFAGRTGGLNFSSDLDNINVDFDTPGAIDGVGVALTLAANNQIGGLSAPTVGEEMRNFEASFDFRNRPNGAGADGFSFSFSNVGDVGPFSETGSGTGLAIEFDTFQNAGEINDNHISVRYDGALLTTVDLNPLAIDLSDNNVHNVEVDFSLGNLDLAIDGTSILSGFDVAGFAPSDGQFVFGARTGGLNGDFFIDNFSAVVNTPEPSSIAIWSVLAMSFAGFIWRRRRSR